MTTSSPWTYDQLYESIPKLTANSSSPTTAADVNPIIHRFLVACPGSSIYDIGGHSVLISITDDIVAKVSLKPRDGHLRHEKSFFELLDRAPCPHIVQSFLRCPDIIVMERLDSGNLYDRMSRANNTSQQIIQWMRQLSGAAAWVESQGLVHGDINPRNILFRRDELKLVDFDHYLLIGDDLDVGYEPYVRGCKQGERGGNYGVAGPVTEQFALGSIFWYMSRGTELYSEVGGRERVNLLIDRQFPAIDPQNPIDNIISRCWLAKYESIEEVFKRVHEIATFGETYQAGKEELDKKVSDKEEAM